MQASPNAKVQGVITKLVCHTLPLFGKSPLSIISFDFLYDSFTHTLPLLSFPVLSAFTLIPSTISHLWNQPCRACQCSRQYADAVLTLLCSFIKRDGMRTYICIYIYIYIQTLAQNRTAVIKISCLATLGNKSSYISTEFPASNFIMWPNATQLDLYSRVQLHSNLLWLQITFHGHLNIACKLCMYLRMQHGRFECNWDPPYMMGNSEQRMGLSCS